MAWPKLASFFLGLLAFRAYGSPPVSIPESLMSRYTMDGSIAYSEFYVDDTIEGKGIHHMYKQTSFNSALKSIETQLGEWTHYLDSLEHSEKGSESESISHQQPLLDEANHNDQTHKFKVEQKPQLLEEMSIPQRFWPLIALERYKHLFFSPYIYDIENKEGACASTVENEDFARVSDTATDNRMDNCQSSQSADISESNKREPGERGAKVLIFGSGSDAWAECLSIALGARSITTVEYSDLTYEHDLVETIKVEEFHDRVLAGEKWDIALSFATFHHDGLGRYGDPLNPDGDIEAMHWMRQALIPHNNSGGGSTGGVAFLSLPVGEDHIVWNLHRIYGKRRLPMMLKNWEVQDRIGWNDELLLPTKELYTNKKKSGHGEDSTVAGIPKVGKKNLRQTHSPVFVLTVQ